MRGKRVSTGLTGLLAIVAATLLVTSSHAASGHSAGASDSANLPTAYFHPSVLYFKAGTTSTRTTTLTNTSAQTLLIQSFALQGLHQNDFSMTTTCGFSLAAGSSCNVTVSGFAPAAGFLGKLVEYDNSAVGHHQVSLQAK